ncbi:MFS transporter [Phaeacidiphilus oryzae]|uniref:MFS transporter n=1 Tax=Phaeacidiphilus oryzae TaxID=348818 RepID=UPI0009FC783E|nr:MFS transporter [Phaeacidiphilus oryzae]
MNKTQPVTSGPQRALRRHLHAQWPAARTAVTGFFLLDGFLFATWVVRIPPIKAQVHASPGALGLALLCISLGAVLTMAFTGRACVRFGTAPVTAATAVLLSLALALPPQTHSVLLLGLSLFVFGIGYGGLNVGMNSAAVDLCAAHPRVQMPSFHAAFSLGGLLGSLVGGAVATGLTPAVHLALAGLIGLLVTAWAGTVLLRNPVAPATAQPPSAADRAPDGRDRTRARTRAVAAGSTLLVVLIGLVALCDAYGEGALADWTTLHLSSDLHATPAVAAWGFSAFSIAMTAGRLAGTRALDRLGPTRLLSGGAGLAAAGMLTAALSPSIVPAILGLLLVGLGLANIFPVAMDRAGALRGAHGVATASTFGYGGMVIGPPVIGFLAQLAGLPLALVSVALLAAISGTLALVVARASRPAPPAADAA